jgi:hypothetical protein
MEDLGFKSWQEQESYSFSKTTTPATVPIQPPTQQKPGFSSSNKVARL